MSDGLTDEAKAELQAAIALIREDRFEKYARTAIKKNTPKPADPPPPPTPQPVDPPPPKNDPPTPPPPKVDPPPTDPPPKKKRMWWGDALDD